MNQLVHQTLNTKNSTQNEEFFQLQSTQKQRKVPSYAKDLRNIFNMEKLNEARKLKYQQKKQLETLQSRVHHLVSQEDQAHRKLIAFERKKDNFRNAIQRRNEQITMKQDYQQMQLNQIKMKKRQVMQHKNELQHSRNSRLHISLQQMEEFREKQKNEKERLKKEHQHVISSMEERAKSTVSKVQREQEFGKFYKSQYLEDKRKLIQDLTYQKWAEEAKQYTSKCYEKLNNLEQEEMNLLSSLQQSSTLYKYTLDEMKEIKQNPAQDLMEQWNSKWMSSRTTSLSSGKVFNANFKKEKSNHKSAALL